jgi:hypothetical protein
MIMCLRLRYHPLLVCVFVTSLSAIASGQTQVAEQKGKWVLENARLRVMVDPNAGGISVLEKAGGRLWEQPPTAAGFSVPVFRNVRKVSDPQSGLVFESDFGTSAGKPNTLMVTLSLSETAADLLVEAVLTQRQQEVENIPFLEPYVLDSLAAVLVIADYSDGHLYPLDLNPFPRSWLSVSRLDMPWVGVCDLQKGYGYAIIVETSDDAYIQMRKVKIAEREVSLPRVGWTPCKKNLTYARRLIYHFSPVGSYVALAKRYRSYAQNQGLVVPFAEKLKKNPNINRLFGAADVWGDASLKFAQEAKAAGVDKMIIHGRSSPEEMKAINELGYLTSEYDNYTDVLPLESGKEVDSQHDRIPENVVLKADGQRMTAWLTFDKKQQFMKRCPAFWVPSAKVVVPKVLAGRPYLGRFIDVTTAEDLYECYDPNHPLTRGDKRNCGVELLSYVRLLGLVTGGEHGLWWAVPHLDYIEGMMSGGWSYPWPAGHLIRPKSKDEHFTSPWGSKYGSWEEYVKWGIGHEYRVPLWELVFHDCIVSTWYWGDASDFLLTAALEVTAKKDAFNILYGTIPLMWANREGSWHTHREIFLRTYRNTCKLHEVIAGTEMLSHEFVTADRAVQRTRFSDGTEVIVNFGPQPYAAELAGKKYLLPENGFAVKGPRIEQSLALIDGRPVTTIRCGDYRYSDQPKDAAGR